MSNNALIYKHVFTIFMELQDVTRALHTFPRVKPTYCIMWYVY